MLERIGKYEIRGELGKGGFGRVYLGHDPTVDRLVAIKVLSSDGDSSNLIRFRTEATAAGNLGHQNIVKVYELGEDNGVFFLVMEYLAGQDLRHVIGTTSLTLIEKIRVMSQVAQGLHCAHQSGVVHRDVKPANIMLLPDGTVKIMDFGIARRTRDNSARLTQSGFLIGTVSYMAPEQFSGIEADALCDVWSFGTIYYELLTGKNPFHAADSAATMYRITNLQPDRIVPVCPGCPEALENVVFKLLAKDRGSRYQSLEDVLLDTAPIQVGMERARATQIMQEAKDLLALGKEDLAQELIRKALTLNPEEQEGRALWQKLKQDSRARATRILVQGFLEKAEKAALDNAYGDAIRWLNSALQLDPSSHSLKERLAQLESAKQRREKTEHLLAQARTDLESQKLTLAFQSATEALGADPKNTEAQILVSRIRKIIADREAERRIKEGLSQAKKLVVFGALDQAIESLQNLLADAPDAIQVREFLSRTCQQRDERDLQIRIRSEIDAAKNLIANGDFATAISRLEQLSQERPNESSVAGMLSFAREELQVQERASKIKSIGNTAWARLKEQNFDEALRITAEGLQAFPENEKLAHLRHVILTARTEHDRSQAIQKAIEESAALEKAGKLDQAIASVDEALRLYPGDAKLGDVRNDLQRKHEELQRKRRAEEIQNALVRARKMIESGQANSATKILTRTISLYPSEPAVASLLEQAQKEEDRQREQREVNAVLSVAHQLEADGELTAALQEIEGGLRLYPSSKELAESAARLRGKVNLEADLVAIKKAIGRGSWTSALKLISDARLRHAADDSLPLLEKQVRGEQQREDLESLCTEAKKQLEAKDLERARKTLAAGRLIFGPEPQLAALESELTRAFDRRRSLEAARRMLDEGKLESAIATLDKMLQADSSDVEVRTLRNSAVREQEAERRYKIREQGLQEIEHLLQSGRFDEAERRIQALLVDFPNDPGVQGVLRRAADGKREHSRRESYRVGREQVATLLNDRRFDAAIGRLKKLSLEFPKDIALEEDLKTVTEAQQQQNRRDHYASERARAGQHISQREFDAAIRILLALQKEFPNDPVLQEELKSAAASKALYEQRQSQDQQVAELERFYRKGDAAGLKDRVSRLDPVEQDPRIRELVEWAHTQIASLSQTGSRESVEVLRRRRLRRLVVYTSTGAVVLLTLLIWYVSSRRTPEGLFDVSPLELSFRVKGGSSSPTSQVVFVNGATGTQSWVSSTTDDWLSVTPSSGVPSTRVQVAVNPAHLSPGPHAGIVDFDVIHGATSKRSVKVNVIVEPADSHTTSGASQPTNRTQSPLDLTLSSINPNSGALGENIRITLTGSHFTKDASIKIASDSKGITVSNITVRGSTQMTAILAIPQNAEAGTIKVLVVDSGRTSGIPFDVKPPAPPTPLTALPTLIAITPDKGQVGGNVQVTLTGSNFVSGAKVNVSNGGVSVSNESVQSSSQITATFLIGANASLGSALVNVVTSGGKSQPVPFSVVGASRENTRKDNALKETTASKVGQNALTEGTCHWRGNLLDGGRLEIDKSGGVNLGKLIGQSDSWRERAVNVRLRNAPSGVTVAEEPSGTNGYKLVVENRSGKEIQILEIKWSRKE